MIYGAGDDGLCYQLDTSNDNSLLTWHHFTGCECLITVPFAMTFLRKVTILGIGSYTGVIHCHSSWAEPLESGPN